MSDAAEPADDSRRAGSPRLHRGLVIVTALLRALDLALRGDVTSARGPAVLVVASGLALAAALATWESRRWGTPVLGWWDALLTGATLPLAGLYVWRVGAAALAAWAGWDAALARRNASFVHLPLILALGTVAGGASGFLLLAVCLGLAGYAWLFWQHAAPAPADRLGRAREALRAGAAAARHPLGAALVVLLLAALRLLHLPADPPVNLGPSGGAWADPGAWAHNARNKLLFGEWTWDDVNFMYVSPITTLGFYLIFLVLGVGHAQVGLLSALAGLAALGVFYLALRSALGRGGAIVATLLLGGNFIFVMYNRIGLVETPAVFFQVLTLYCGQRGTRDPRYFALAGVTSVIPVLVKMQMTYIVPAALLAILLWGLRWPPRPEPGPRSLAPVGLYLGGAAAGALVLAAAWIIPHWEPFTFRLTSEWHLYSLPFTLPRLFRNVFYNPWVVYFLGSPVLLLLSGLAACCVLERLLGGRGPVPFVQLFAFWWLVGGFAYLAIVHYRPLRYYVSLLPPMAILATTALLALWRARPSAPRALRPLVVWTYGVGAVVVGLTAAGYLYARSPTTQVALAALSLYPLTEVELAALVTIGVLAVGAAVFAWLGPRLPSLLGRVPPWGARALAAGLLVVGVVGEGVRYLDWKLHRSYTLVSVSRGLERRLPEGAVIAGIYSRALALENRHRAVAIWDRYGNWRGDPLARFGVTHVAVADYLDEIGYYHRRFPEAMRRARKLDEWILWKTRVSLYELPRADGARAP